jgi:hypothetical protein
MLRRHGATDAGDESLGIADVGEAFSSLPIRGHHTICSKSYVSGSMNETNAEHGHFRRENHLNKRKRAIMEALDFPPVLTKRTVLNRSCDDPMKTSLLK